MSHKKQQVKKQAERKEQAKRKVLAIRRDIRAQAKKDQEERRIHRLFRERQLPFKKSEINKDGDSPEKIAMIKKQLEHNMEILKALEEAEKEEIEKSSD